jgi:hypothetical protein
MESPLFPLKEELDIFIITQLQGLIPDKGKILSLLQNVQTDFADHPDSYSVGIGKLFSRG